MSETLERSRRAQPQRELNRAAEELVDLAIEMGKLAHRHRAWAIDYARNDPEGFGRALRTMPPAPPIYYQVDDAVRRTIIEGRAHTYAQALRILREEEPELLDAYVDARDGVSTRDERSSE